jgi:hypothetical protein
MDNNYRVRFEIDIQDFDIETDVTEQWRGTAESDVPFVPSLDLLIGPSSMLTVRNVHWMGGNRINIFCGSIWVRDWNVDDVAGAIERIKRESGAIGLEWTFVRVEDEDGDPPPPR